MLKKIEIEEVAPLLPEVGDPILVDVRKIEKLKAEKAELDKRIEEAREELLERIQGTWNRKEMMKATVQVRLTRKLDPK